MPYSFSFSSCSLAWRKWKPRDSVEQQLCSQYGRRVAMEELDTFSVPRPSPPPAATGQRGQTWGPLQNTRETTKHVEACTPARQLKQGKMNTHSLKMEKKKPRVLAGGVNRRAHSLRGGLAQIFLCKYLWLEKYEYVSTHGLAYDLLKTM